MGRLLRRWADPITRRENVRLRAETRNLRRIVRDLNHGFKTVEHVAAMRSAHVGRLQMELAAARQEIRVLTESEDARLVIAESKLQQQGETK